MRGGHCEVVNVREERRVVASKVTGCPIKSHSLPSALSAGGGRVNTGDKKGRREWKVADGGSINEPFLQGNRGGGGPRWAMKCPQPVVRRAWDSALGDIQPASPRALFGDALASHKNGIFKSYCND